MATRRLRGGVHGGLAFSVSFQIKVLVLWLFFVFFVVVVVIF
jgi:hypothetical protein